MRAIRYTLYLALFLVFLVTGPYMQRLETDFDALNFRYRFNDMHAELNKLYKIDYAFLKVVTAFHKILLVTFIACMIFEAMISTRKLPESITPYNFLNSSPSPAVVSRFSLYVFTVTFIVILGMYVDIKTKEFSRAHYYHNTYGTEESVASLFENEGAHLQLVINYFNLVIVCFVLGLITDFITCIYYLFRNICDRIINNQA